MASLSTAQFVLRSVLVLAAATAFAAAPLVETEAVESDSAPVLIAPSIAGPVFIDTISEPATLDATGACCIAGGFFMPPQCVNLNAGNCALNSGVFLGVGTSCVEEVCPDPVVIGACCLPQGPFGTCIDTSEDNCDALGGVFNPGVPCFLIFCTQVPPPTGACCIQTLGACVEVNNLDCVFLNGQYQGNGTTCTPSPCN